MCGIAGVVSRRSQVTALVPPVNAMLNSVRHRGPDDEGAWTDAAGDAAFAHTRLAILDPTPAGHQPMSTPDGRFTIAFNGEILNFKELRRSLEARGVCFHTRSDTEVILRAYEADGSSCLRSLRGMFAFALWDAREQTCLLARDPFGIKPLYYHEAGGVLTFASEVRAILAAGVRAVVDATGAFEYFRTGSVPEPLTMIQDVRALEAGHFMTWRDGRLSIQRYWDIDFPDSDASDDPATLTRTALLDSVAHHLVSDVPVGVFLSGGMDSTAIVALTRTLRDGDLRTFSLSFPSFQHDEGPDARRTAQHFKTTHHEWAVDGATAWQMFGEFLTAADQPSIDGFNTFLVARLARRHHTKVVLSGLGGDELFGGYPSFRQVPRLVKLGQLASFGGLVSAAALRLAGDIGGSRYRRFAALIESSATLESAYMAFRGIYTREEARALTAHYVGDRTAIDEVERRRPPTDPTAEDGVSRLELTRYMRNQLLRDADVMSMASGVELRVPFIDSVLFGTLSRLPARQRLQRGKALLHQAVPEVPDWIANQPKRGFVLPFQRWLERDWTGAALRVNPPSVIKMDTWYRKLSVVSFEHWLQRVSAQHV